MCVNSDDSTFIILVEMSFAIHCILMFSCLWYLLTIFAIKVKILNKLKIHMTISYTVLDC